jgi:hypothetical protein
LEISNAEMHNLHLDNSHPLPGRMQRLYVLQRKKKIYKKGLVKSLSNQTLLSACHASSPLKMIWVLARQVGLLG